MLFSHRYVECKAVINSSDQTCLEMTLNRKYIFLKNKVF